MQRIAIPSLMFVWLLLGALSTRAQEAPSPSAATPPRLSLADGQVSFWRPGGEDWAPARTNTPLAAGDSIYTGPGGNAEFQVGERAYVRIGESTQLQLSGVEPDFVQFKVTAGEASVDLRQLAPGHTVEVDTPNAAYTIEHIGYYRFNVNQQATTVITRRGGSATLTPANGPATRVSASEEVVAAGTDTLSVETYAAPDLDSWDRWNYSRTDHLLDSMSARYVPPEVYGAADLDHSGSWRTVPEYGAIWVPDGVAPAWAPYSAGHWISDPAFGWTWVDDAPWGWAPYHYGRWVYVNGFWGWAPGPAVAHPVYAPALVAWLGGVRITAGVGVGWVALGWGEPLLPWWGPRGYVGVPSWGGWGGPRVVNRTVINTTTVNVTNINVQNITYANTHVRNAVMATSTEHFARGGREFTHPSPEQLHEVRPIERGIDVRPTPASLSPGEGHAARPPREFIDRKVVARRPASDSNTWMHAEGRRAPEHVGEPSQVGAPASGTQVDEHRGPSHTDNVPDEHWTKAAPTETRREAFERHDSDGHERSRPSPGAIPGQAEERWRASAPTEIRQETSDRHDSDGHEQSRPAPGAMQGQQGKPLSPTPPERHADAPTATQPANPGAARRATVERMRPPPAPSFNEWRNQQQSAKPQESRGGGPVHSAGSFPSAPSTAAPKAQPAHGSGPVQQNGERSTLPGEPAMKLRPANVAAVPNRNRDGGKQCKEHDCR